MWKCTASRFVLAPFVALCSVTPALAKLSDWNGTSNVTSELEDRPAWPGRLRCAALPAWGRWCRFSIAGVGRLVVAAHAQNDRVSQYVCNSGKAHSDEIRSLRDMARHFGSEMAFRPVTLADRKVVLDIGAHIGLFALAWALLGHKVIAIEANPMSAQLLRASICRNNLEHRIHIHVVALSRFDHGPTNHCVLRKDPTEKKMVTFCRYQLCCPPSCRHTDKADSIHKIQVTTLPVLFGSTYLRNLGSIDLMKIDVEGHECEVLRDADAFWKNFAPTRIFTEVMGAYQKRESRLSHPLFNCTRGFYLRMLQNRGYKIVYENWAAADYVFWYSDVFLAKLSEEGTPLVPSALQLRLRMLQMGLR